MSIDTTSTNEALKELREAIVRLSSGVTDAAAAQAACARMDHMREELRERIGTVSMAVDLVREARDP